MKFSKDQVLLQTLWEDILNAYYKCPQSKTYDKVCPFDNVETLLIYIISPHTIGLNGSMKEILIDKGYFIHLSKNTKHLYHLYTKYKLQIFKKLAESYEDGSYLKEKPF